MDKISNRSPSSVTSPIDVPKKQTKESISFPPYEYSPILNINDNSSKKIEFKYTLEKNNKIFDHKIQISKSLPINIKSNQHVKSDKNILKKELSIIPQHINDHII